MPITPAQQEALDAFEAHGGVKSAAAALGISKTSMKERLQRGRANRDIDPATQTAMDAVGALQKPKRHWTKTDKHGNVTHSVLFEVEPDDETSLIDRLQTAFTDLPAATPIVAPEHHDEDLVTVYPLADCHIGMMAWGKETGEDYDTAIAVDRLRNWIGRAVDASPASAEALILDVGDLTHADDQTNQTPRGKHILDVDTRHFRTVELTIAALAYAVEYTLRRHARVTVKILPGNHNPTSYMTILFALAERYRNEPRVTVLKVPGEFFVMEFGSVMLAAHHGHGAKPERLVTFLADEHAPMWGRTRHRFLWTGHLHHLKAADIGGCTWEQLRAVTARDAYSIGGAYSARAQLQAITIHRTRGEIQRAKVAA